MAFGLAWPVLSSTVRPLVHGYAFARIGTRRLWRWLKDWKKSNRTRKGVQGKGGLCYKRAVADIGKTNGSDLYTITLFSRLGRMPITLWVEYTTMQTFNTFGTFVVLGGTEPREGYAILLSDSGLRRVITPNCHCNDFYTTYCHLVLLIPSDKIIHPICIHAFTISSSTQVQTNFSRNFPFICTIYHSPQRITTTPSPLLWRFLQIFFPWWPFLFIKKTAFDLDHMGYMDVMHTIWSATFVFILLFSGGMAWTR